MTHQQAVVKHAVERYLLDEMPEIERFDFEAHLFDCRDCAEDVRLGALMKEGVAAGLLPEPAARAAVTSVHGIRPPAWRVAMPWAVAAAMALAVGYQALWAIPGLRDQAVRPTALAPVTLRGATRGVEPTVVRPRSGVVALAVDLAGVPGGARLTYDLRGADGVSVATGTVVAPPPGTPLLLLMPASAFDAAGRYVLTVRAADGPGSEGADYRFTVTEG